MVAQTLKSTRVAPRSKSDPVLRRQHVPMSSAEVRRGTSSSLLIRVGGLSSIGNKLQQEQRPWHWMAQLSGTYIRRRGILLRQTGGTPQDYAVNAIRTMSSWIGVAETGSVLFNETGVRCCIFVFEIATSFALVPGEQPHRPDPRLGLLLLPGPSESSPVRDSAIQWTISHEVQAESPCR